MATKRANAVLKIGAIDKVSRVVSKIKNRFGPLNRTLDKTARKFKVIQLSTQKFRSRLNKVGKTMSTVGRKATVGLSAPIGLAFGGAIRAGLNYQKAINTVGAVTQTVIKGEVSDSFKLLDKTAKELGRTTAFSATEVANAMTELGRKNFDTQEIIAASKPILDLAIATNFGLAESADIVSNSIRAFGLDAKDATTVADLFAKATASSGIDMESLGETFKAVAPIASAYGASIQEATAITGLLGNVGIKGSVAGTALKNMFLKLAAPSSKASKIMKKLGVEVSNADGSMRGIGEIITELGPKLNALPKKGQMAALNELFGLRGIAGGSALMAQALKDGKDPVKAFTDIISDSKGATADMVATMRRDGVGAIQDFWSALEGAGIALAKSGLMDGLTMLANAATSVFRWFSDLPGPIRTTIAVFFGLLAVLGPLLIVAGFMAGAISSMITLWGLLSAAGGIAAIATTALGAAFNFLFAPITLTIGAILLVIGALWLLWKNFDTISDFFKGVWDGVIDGLMGFFNKTVEVASKIKSFFGFGGDKLEGDINVNDRTRTGLTAQGTPVGAERVQQSVVNRDFVSRTNNAKVDVNVKGPEGTKAVGTADDLGFFNLNVGRAGGI